MFGTAKFQSTLQLPQHSATFGVEFQSSAPQLLQRPNCPKHSATSAVHWNSQSTLQLPQHFRTDRALCNFHRAMDPSPAFSSPAHSSSFLQIQEDVHHLTHQTWQSQLPFKGHLCHKGEFLPAKHPSFNPFDQEHDLFSCFSPVRCKDWIVRQRHMGNDVS